MYQYKGRSTPSDICCKSNFIRLEIKSASKIFIKKNIGPQVNNVFVSRKIDFKPLKKQQNIIPSSIQFILPMYEEIRDRAITNLEKKRKKVRAMQIIGVIFGSAALFLFFIRYLMFEGDRPYMFIPIGILAIVYAIIHTAVLGLPFTGDNEITEEDIELEVIKVFRRYKSSDLQDISEEEELELKQLEQILDNDDEYV